MINDLYCIASSLSGEQRSVNRQNHEYPGPSGKKDGNLSICNNQDIVEISGQMPVSQNVEMKALPPVNGQDGHMQYADVQNAESFLSGPNELDGPKSAESEDRTKGRDEMSEDEHREVEDLKKRDKEVRQHEQAHLAAGGRYAHRMSLEYQAGPDGKRYAVGGEVSLDTSPVPGDSDATNAKAKTIRRAANAPAHPSSQDRQVAAAAYRMENSARMEKMKEVREEEGAENVSFVTSKEGLDIDQPDDFRETNNNICNSAFSKHGQKKSEIGKVLNIRA